MCLILYFVISNIIKIFSSQTQIDYSNSLFVNINKILQYLPEYRYRIEAYAFNA